MNYKQKMLPFLLVILFSTFNLAFAKPKGVDPKSYLKAGNGANTLYIENKGQIGNQDGKPNPAVKYLILRPGLNIQLKANSFSYDAYTIERFKRVEQLPEPVHHKFDKQDDDSLVYHFSRVDIELVDANPSPRITQEGASSDYLNYYTHITSQTNGEEGATGVRGYSSITYHDIYQNIDLEWFLDKEGKPEYQFIINPGGDPSRIRLKYYGAKKTELISDAIHIHMKPGIIKEHIPVSYLKESKEKVQISFVKLSNNEYGFEYPKYASNETLVIDPVPNRLWGTYYGGSGQDQLYDIVIDLSDNIYIGGWTNSSTDIASSGAWDEVYSSGYFDALLVKISSNSNRIWGTYYGGSRDDQISGIVNDKYGNILICGSTYSSTDIATTGAWDIVFGGSGWSDAFLVKFNSLGVRIWGTYYGGNKSDYGNKIAIDSTDNIYICGTTESIIDIASTGSWDVTMSGNDDAFVAKFNSNGNRIWGTYYGGSNSDKGNDLVIDLQGNVLLFGTTSSTTDIASTGAWDETFGGGIFDSFLTKFSNSGSRIWGTYYGGNGDDKGNGFAIDNKGNIYLTGVTSSTTDIASTGAWDETFGGGLDDAFLSKFSNSGTRLWGTYYGGNSQDFGVSIMINRSGNVFFSGYTASTTNISSIGAWSFNLNGGFDCFIAKFSPTSTRDWGTYYGGKDSEGHNGQSLALDSNENLYLAGHTYSITDIATNEAWDQVYGGTSTNGFDGFVVKLDVSNKITLPTNSRNSFCQGQEFSLPFNVTGTYSSPNTFTAQLSDSNGSFNNPIILGDLISVVSSTITCRIPIGTPVGTKYRIRIISTNPSVISSDNGSNISVDSIPIPYITGDISTCVSVIPIVYSVSQNPGHTCFWQLSGKNKIVGSPFGNSISVLWNISGIDTLKVRQTNTTTGCFKDTAIIVNVSELPAPTITGEQSICLSSTPSTFTVNQIPGFSIEWEKPRLGSIVSYKLNAVSIIWNASGTDSVRVKIKDNVSGCERDTILRVMIMKSPEPLITGDARACENQSPRVYRVQKQSGRTYTWNKPKNGIIVGSTTSDSISVQWVNSGSDTLRMEERDNSTKCTKDTSFIVSIAPLPDVTIIGSNQVRENEQGITYSVKNESGLSYNWSIASGDATITGKTGNSVTLNAGKPGTVKLNVKVTNQNGCMSESELIITVKSLTGIREISSTPFTLYPNPAGDHLYVKMDAEITGDIDIELYDVLGNRHFKQTYQLTEIIRIPVQSLSQGMYMIKVKTLQGEYMERFVK